MEYLIINFCSVHLSLLLPSDVNILQVKNFKLNYQLFCRYWQKEIHLVHSGLLMNFLN